MNDVPFDFARFLGNFHPVLVHLPIGGLVVVVTLEILSHCSRFKDAARSNRLILFITAVGFLSAGACGWLLAQAKGYDQQLLSWHRWSGLTVTAACVVTLLACSGNWQRFYRVSLFATLALLLVASHLGGSITHGSDFLTRNAPAWFRSLLREPPSSGQVVAVRSELLQGRVFDLLIQPILLERCTSCHGPEKAKGRLRLDSLEALLRGGDNGPVLVPGKAGDSEIIRRVLLPVENEDHMPPEDKPQLTPEEIALLQWWINAGTQALPAP